MKLNAAILTMMTLFSAPALACFEGDRATEACRRVRANLEFLEQKLTAVGYDDLEKVDRMVAQFLSENKEHLDAIVNQGKVARLHAFNLLQEFGKLPATTSPSHKKMLAQMIDDELSVTNQYADFLRKKIVAKMFVRPFHEFKRLSSVSQDVIVASESEIGYVQALRLVGEERNLARLVESGSEQAEKLAQDFVDGLRKSSVKDVAKADQITNGVLKASKTPQPQPSISRYLKIGTSVR